MEFDNSSATILLVEDDPGDQALTRRACEHSSTRLEVVENGQQALDYLLRRGAHANPTDSPRPAFVLLDLNLDGESGFALLESIRNHPELSDTVVVVLTTSASDEDVRRSYELRANSFITKPTRLEDWNECFRVLEHYWLRIVRLPTERTISRTRQG